MRFAWLVVMAALGFAQTEHKPRAEDYPVHTEVMVLGKPVQVGAEYMVHSFSAGEEAYIAPEFLVVEVALFPAKGEALQVSLAQFLLRINGKKQALVPQDAQLVAASLTRPEWRSGPRLEGVAGMGGMGVGIGQPRPATIPQMPPPPGTPRNPPQVPQDNPGGIERRERIKPEELCVRTALPPGEYRKPVSGFLYFAYKGKASSIKSLELLYQDGVVKLQ